MFTADYSKYLPQASCETPNPYAPGPKIQAGRHPWPLPLRLPSDFSSGSFPTPWKEDAQNKDTNKESTKTKAFPKPLPYEE